MTTTKPKHRRISLWITEGPKPPPREKPVPVLVEVAVDGFLTIYGPKHVRPVVFNRLVVNCSEGATLVDQFHELDFPIAYRQFYCPRHILKTHNAERRTVAGETRRRQQLATLRDYQQLAETCTKGGDE